MTEFKINLTTEYTNKLLSKNKRLDPTLDGFVITYSQLIIENVALQCKYMLYLLTINNW